jgi:toxin-antitoxin system PIN domain toxin
MLVVDTNVFVYAADLDSPFHRASRRWLEERRRSADAWFTTWGILYEFLRITTHPRVMHAPWSATKAWAFVEEVVASPGLEVLVETDRHPRIAREVLDGLPALSGNLLHDAHTAILMREHGLRRIATRDTDFHRFPFLEPFDPTS